MKTEDQLEPESAQELLDQQGHCWPLPAELVDCCNKKGKNP